MTDGYELKQVKVRLKLAESEPLYSKEKINSPEKAVEVMADALAQLDREYCVVVNLDGAHHAINFNLVSIGDTDQAYVPIQNVFKSGLLSNSSELILLHNHPSGSLDPSPEDMEVTKHLIQAGRIMNIPVIDHIIVAGGTAEHVSLRERYPEMFEMKDAEFFVHESEDYQGLLESAFKLGDRYVSIQRTEEGIDYSIYDESYHLLDGGVLDDPDLTVGDAAQMFVNELKQPVYDVGRDTYTHTPLQGNIRQNDIMVNVEYDELMEKVEAVGQEEIQTIKSAQKVVDDFRAKTEEHFDRKALDGMSSVEIEEAVRTQVQQVIETYGMDAVIEDVIISGSRCRGLETKDSDLDVVVSYSGSEREDDFFGLLHEEKIYFGKVELDIKSINTEQTGTLEKYLPGVEKYLAEKAKEINRNLKETPLSPVENVPKQIMTFTVAECSEFHSHGAFYRDVTDLQEAINLYEDLKQNSSLNAVPAIGINIHTEGTDVYEDMQSDFLYGGRLDLETLTYQPEMCRNPEVIKALHDMQAAYPDVEVVGRFPDEQIQEAKVSQDKSQEQADKVSDYKPLAKVEEMEEQNYNMIDNVLNNMPKGKKPRRRISMKAKLAEKKAEVEKREKEPPDKAKTSKYPGMGVDD